MYIVVLYRIVYLLLLRCCLDGNDVSAACPKTSDDYTRDTLAAETAAAEDGY